jgi:hypothetical protein
LLNLWTLFSFRVIHLSLAARVGWGRVPVPQMGLSDSASCNGNWQGNTEVLGEEPSPGGFPLSFAALRNLLFTSSASWKSKLCTNKCSSPVAPPSNSYCGVEKGWLERTNIQ